MKAYRYDLEAEEELEGALAVSPEPVVAFAHKKRRRGYWKSRLKPS